MKSRINREAREISISELWWYVISKWKWLVVGMVVGALVLGAYGAYSAYKANEAARANVPKEYTMEDLTDEEQIEVNDLIDDYELYLAEKKDFQDNYVMNLDYNNVTYWLVTYYVDTDYSYNYLSVEENYAATLISMYKTYIHSDEIYEKILALGISGLQEKDIGYICSVSNEGYVIKIGIIADEKNGELIKDTLCTAIEEYKIQTENFIGEHEFVKVSEDVRVAYSEGIKNAQSYKLAILTDLLNNIEQLKAKFTEKQIVVFDEQIAEVDNESNNELTEQTEKAKTKTLINIKYVFVGLVAGVVIVVLVVINGYIRKKILRSLDEIKQVYNIDVLGNVLRDNIPNREMLGKMNGISTDIEELKQREYIAEVIVSKCKKNNVTEIAISSSISSIFESNSVIFEKVAKAGIACNCISGINYDQNALNKAIESQNVIIIEILNETSRKDLEAQIDTCDNLSINILGMIVII